MSSATTSRFRIVPVTAVGALAVATALTGCSSQSSPPKRQLVVAAAASLNVPFDRLVQDFERANPDVDVALSYGGSSTLAAGIVAGSPIEVFASANQDTMDLVSRSGLTASTPTVFAANRMTIALPAQNRAGVTSLADLARLGTTVAVCQPEVPCGVGAQTVFDLAGLDIAPATQEPDVSAVLTKVRTDQVDAGIVYVSDVVTSSGSVSEVAIPPSQNTTTSYPIAPLTSSTQSELANSFVAFVLSATGQSVLADSGFLPPPGS
jgi:molybdate transport system substrate-binding protein